MRRALIRSLFPLVVTLVMLIGLGCIAAAEPQCTTLKCSQCASICQAKCEADYKACNAAGERGCERASRSCDKGCHWTLCAQCMPVQYTANNRKFYQGTVELCRTPGYEK